jgi:hypothetical protein
MAVEIVLRFIIIRNYFMGGAQSAGFNRHGLIRIIGGFTGVGPGCVDFGAGGAVVGQSNGVSADGLKLYAARQVLSTA